VTPLRRLTADINTEPVAYLHELYAVIEECQDEFNSALVRSHRTDLRVACLRLEAIGMLAGIAGRKLDAA
jgi:hypothetical protein